ncbi:hypothetical protein DPX16_23419 [Anabarilius grahami]|uniref:Uncharacterized protein n=1 Tax=Anabarilius grahami TaxID=495550 RepID=A0A3N0Y0H2_ANAGA|nr:hypothetical protein DPX16_23419 [Anabarilius grahami]
MLKIQDVRIDIRFDVRSVGGEETVCRIAAVSSPPYPSPFGCWAGAAEAEYKLLAAAQTAPEAERCYPYSPFEELGCGQRSQAKPSKGKTDLRAVIAAKRASSKKS